MDRNGRFQPQTIGDVLYIERVSCADHSDREYLVNDDGGLKTLYKAFYSPAE
jgi:hypothetical protein